MTPEAAFVALGSNLGPREAHLTAARTALAALPRTTLTRVSTIEETAPLGGADQPPYLNQMVRLQTGLSPRELLLACQAIERAAGRERRERWASRTLDLDIVLFGTRTISDPDLTIPHPGLAHRDFWRRELAELRTDDG